MLKAPAKHRGVQGREYEDECDRDKVNGRYRGRERESDNEIAMGTQRRWVGSGTSGFEVEGSAIIKGALKNLHVDAWSVSGYWL